MGWSINIVQLSENDGWQTAANKINDNFRNLYRSVTNNGDNGVQVAKVETDQKIKDAEARLDRAITEAEERINEEIDSAEDRLDDKIKQLQDLLDQLEDKVDDDISGAVDKINTQITTINTNISTLTTNLNNKTQPKNFAPAVGTYMYCLVNPNTIWTGTTWQQQGQGNFLIAAGSNYTAGNSYGSNTVTLTVNQIPAHTHNVSSDRRMSMVGDSISAGMVYSYSSGSNAQRITNSGLGGTGLTNTGGGQAHNNIPQSIAVPLWKRTA